MKASPTRPTRISLRKKPPTTPTGSPPSYSAGSRSEDLRPALGSPNQRDLMCQRCPTFTRRFVTLGLSAAALTACSDNPVSGRSQFAFVPDDMLAQFADQSWRVLASQVPLAG